MLDPTGPIADAFPFIFGAILVIIVIVIVIIGVSAVRSHKRIWRAGYDPMTLQADLATRAMGSRLLESDKSMEERLRELDDLRAKNSISPDEYAAARAEVLKGR